MQFVLFNILRLIIVIADKTPIVVVPGNFICSILPISSKCHSFRIIVDDMILSSYSTNIVNLLNGYVTCIPNQFTTARPLTLSLSLRQHTETEIVDEKSTMYIPKQTCDMLSEKICSTI